MYGTLDISTSGMVAQRTRMAVIASNIVNASTIEDAEGNLSVYKKRRAMFAAGDPTAAGDASKMGVHVSTIEADEDAIRMRHMPGHKFADEKGYVPWPDIDPTVEMIDMLEATRAYEANVQAAQATKQMVAQALRLLA